jgi:hypothetical protein
MTRESHHIQRALLLTCAQETSYHSHWLQTRTAKCTKQGPTKIPQSVAKCSNTTSSKAPPPPHEHYLEVLPSMALLVSMTSLRDNFFSQSDWGGYTSMRLFTTNGMDVKGMKGYTNLPNRMSRDGPQRKLGFSPLVG